MRGESPRVRRMWPRREAGNDTAARYAPVDEADALRAQVAALQAENTELKAQIEGLRARLGEATIGAEDRF